MMRIEVVPRLPYVVRPVEGIPGTPLQPIEILVPADGGAHAWASLYAHLHALHMLYGRVGIRRPMGKLHDLTVALTPVLNRICGVQVTRCALTFAHRAVEALDDEHLQVLSHGQEAGWWIVALQASYALGVWYGLAPDADPSDEAIVSDVALRVRRILATVFDRRVVEAIQDVAHGDGAGDLLAQVAEGAILLGAPLHGVPDGEEVS